MDFLKVMLNLEIFYQITNYWSLNTRSTSITPYRGEEEEPSV